MDREPVIGPSNPVGQPPPVHPKTGEQSRTVAKRRNRRSSPRTKTEGKSKKDRKEDPSPSSHRIDRYA